MNATSKTAFRTQLPVFLVQLALCAAMLGVYAVIGRLNAAVLFGAVVGAAVSVLNYVALIFSLLQAQKSDSPQKGQLKAQGNYILRMLAIIAVLVTALKLGKTEPIATLLPLILMRVALFIGGLMVKKEPKGELAE